MNDNGLLSLKGFCNRAFIGTLEDDHYALAVIILALIDQRQSANPEGHSR
jgi:hypothetical protein